MGGTGVASGRADGWAGRRNRPHPQPLSCATIPRDRDTRCHLTTAPLDRDCAPVARPRAPQAVPLALAENSGLPPIESLTAVKKRQLEEKNPYLGIDCNDTGERRERRNGVGRAGWW